MSSTNTTQQAESIWQRLFRIKHDDPNLNEQTWSEVQPCETYRLFGKDVFITQPSSSFWVYLLGIMTTILGVFFLVDDQAQMSRSLWGVSLILWGVGALIAGTSYQAFGYQLKCKGRPRAVWTSWWEVVYLVFQQVSINVMLVAVAYSCLGELGQTISIIIASLVSVAYTLMVAYGAFKPMKTLITFEMMVHACTPFIVFFIALNGWRYWQDGQALDLALLGTWFGLILTMWLFEKYMAAGITEKLWKEGKWFSENDVLHVALIIWVLYLAIVLEPLVVDLNI
ncbi:hypothetical protein EOL70_03230 [Leucothrix sargassi]|nr:hypothetical protein EOL70_03230 [Leucothrix sargassi]